jgi:hypothetical protein
METAQKCLLQITKATLQVLDLLTHNAILLGHATDLVGEVLDFLGITNKVAPLLCNDVLSVVLQLKQVLGIVNHVHLATMVLNQKDIAYLIHASHPLWLRVAQERIQRDGRACSSGQVLRAQGGECHVSSLLHSIVHVALIAHVDHELPSGNTGWDEIST